MNNPDPSLNSDTATTVARRVAQQEQAARLSAFDARMEARRAKEEKGAKATPIPPPKPPMPPDGRECRACNGSGRVTQGRTCPSCVGAGWKWMMVRTSEVGVEELGEESKR